MGLLDDIAAVDRPAFKCKFARWVDEQDTKYQAEIDEALKSDFPSRTIWRVLASRHGNFVSADVFDRHRKNGCGCVAQ